MQIEFDRIPKGEDKKGGMGSKVVDEANAGSSCLSRYAGQADA